MEATKMADLLDESQVWTFSARLEASAHGRSRMVSMDDPLHEAHLETWLAELRRVGLEEVADELVVAAAAQGVHRADQYWSAKAVTSMFASMANPDATTLDPKGDYPTSGIASA